MMYKRSLMLAAAVDPDVGGFNLGGQMYFLDADGEGLITESGELVSWSEIEPLLEDDLGPFSSADEAHLTFVNAAMLAVAAALLQEGFEIGVVS